MRGSRPRAVISWSSGKDSAYALWQVLREKRFEVVGLLCTVTGTYRRVSMHGVREELLDRQAEASGLPLRKVVIPSPCPNSVYEQAMAEAVSAMKDEGVSHLVFGDLFLRDVRAYRESRLANSGLTPVFPLWGRDTKVLAREMIGSGLMAQVVCLDPRKLPKAFGGRLFDLDFLRDLPPSVDPCGENGEFHTFVTGGPMFSHPIPVVEGPVVERDGFVFADLMPG